MRRVAICITLFAISVVAPIELMNLLDRCYPTAPTQQDGTHR